MRLKDYGIKVQITCWQEGYDYRFLSFNKPIPLSTFSVPNCIYRIFPIIHGETETSHNLKQAFFDPYKFVLFVNNGNYECLPITNLKDIRGDFIKFISEHYTIPFKHKAALIKASKRSED